jgi:transposase
MAGGDAEGLFAALPEQRAPMAPAGGRPRLRCAERGQVELRALSLDQLLPADHRARQVWAFVEGLDLGPLHDRIRAVEGHAGHPPADPRLLVALWLQATLDGVGSARELARRCEAHLAYQWLAGGVGMNHKSLAEFRVGQGELLERLLTDGFAALLRAGIARLERIAQDGMRVRASAGAASFRRASTLRECRRAAETRVRELRAELEADPGAASRREAAARQRAARERQERVERALMAAEELTRQRQQRAAKDGRAKAAKEPRASTTDPAAGRGSMSAGPGAGRPRREARVMKMADAGWRPAYNVQLASDTQSGLIAAVAVDASGSDMGKLAPMSDRLAELYGRRPAQHLADGGYVGLADIERLEQAGSEVIAPPPRPRDPGRDRHLPLPDDPPGVAVWRRRMGGEAAKAVYKQRAATAELANAQARNRGLVRLVVRGTAKVKAVVLWLALAHNLARSWTLAAA